MNIRPQLRMPLLAAALAASVASAWATYELGSVSYVPPGSSSYVPAPTIESRPEPAPATAVGVESTLAPNETVVTVEQPAAPTAEATRERVLAPVADRSAPAITVTEPRLTVDQRIQADVIDLLARNPRLSGKIGVVSEDAIVTLTGYTLTSGQAWRAGRDARGVYGVRHVVNEIRPRVGGITS
jgi:hypothetical protein